MKFPSDSTVKFNRHFALQMKKEFELFELCMEEVFQTYEAEGDKTMSAFIHNILITIKVMLFSQLRSFLNYLDQNVQLNE